MRRVRRDGAPRGRRRSTRRICLFTASWLLGASLASAFGQTTEFVDRTEVRVVHLDVLVVGRDGAPVTNLGAADFRIEEDGAPVEVDFFEPPGTVLAGSDETGEASFAEQPRVSGPAEWIVYVDDLRLDGGARKRVLRDLEATLQGWQDGAGVPGGAKLRLVIQREADRLESGPFDQPRDLLAALRARPKAGVTGVITTIARRQALERLAGIREACLASGRSICEDCWGELLAEATQHAVTEVQRVQQSTFHLADLLARLDPTDGRRSVLYVGNGMPMLAGASVLWSLADQCSDRRAEIEGEVATYTQRRTLAQLGALANAQRTALHLLDAGGLRHGLDPNDTEHFRNLQAGLQTLAEQTGGTAVLNANRVLEPVAEVVAEEQARYQLGYTLTRPASGRVHSLRVTLVGDAARGRRVHHRQTYWDRTSDMRLHQQLLAAVEPTGVERVAGSTEGVELKVAGLEPIDKRTRRLQLEITIDGERVAVLPVGPGGRRQGAVSLGLLSVEPGRRAEPRIQRISLGDAGLPANEVGDYQVTIGLTVPRGRRVLVVGVRDEATGEVLLQRLETKVD